MVDCNPNFVQIIEIMREQFGELHISVFYPLYKKFYIWKNEVSVLSLWVCVKKFVA